MEQHHHVERSGFRRLQLALAIVVTVMVAEVLGGIFSGSLSLLGDAGHMLVDAFALGLSLFAMTMARRPATATKTFGYHRLEILAALANGVILMLVSIAVFYEAYKRLLSPPVVETPLMLGVAVIGLVANVGGLLLLRSPRHGSLNVQSAFWHILGDTVSSLGVIIAGIVILLTGWYPADTFAALFIGIIIVWGAVRIVRAAADILLEAVPRHLDLENVAAAIREIPGVNEVHDMHIWTITSGIFALSTHLVIDDQSVSGSVEIIEAVQRELSRRYNISHTTLQLECDSCPSGLVCKLDPHDTGKDAD
ncbi:MAG: cation diffusion facilitator family transporter [Chloroflexota bacterium]